MLCFHVLFNVYQFYISFLYLYPIYVKYLEILGGDGVSYHVGFFLFTSDVLIVCIYILYFLLYSIELW